MKTKKDDLGVWEAVRDELRKLRGKNRFRGNEEHLLLRREVRIHRESRGNQLESGVVIIHLTQRLEDLWADGLLHVPARVSEMKDGSADENWRQWLGWIVDECRGAAYLHTSSASAAYRKSDTGKETNN